MKSFLIRMLSVLLTAASLGVYQHVTELRERDDQIARLTAELASTKNMVTALQAAAEAAAEAARGPYTDGTYTGSGEGYGGAVAVELTVVDGWIEDIAVTDHAKEDASFFSMAEAMLPAMLEEQSWEVDTVSGTTMSSRGIQDAVRAALEAAEGK